MGKRSRFRRAAKWAGAGASVVVLLLWAASYFWQAMFMWTGKTWWWETTCGGGTLTLSWFPSDSKIALPRGMRTGLYLFPHAWLAEHTTVNPQSVAHRYHYGFVVPRLLARTGVEMRSNLAGNPGLLWILVPLWLLLLLAGVPTAFLFWRDRRKPPGHCRQCGYDLTGNVSGRCPECGAEIVPTRD